ncbi:hypothetical protein Tco_0170079 [Tanacetum coccineum]
MSSYNHFGCSWCGGPFNGGNCPGCSNVGSGNEFVYDPNPYSYNETPNFFNQPPQPQYETYSCELCGNDSHYGFDCPPRLPLVYEQEPCYNQNFSDNYYPQNSPSFSQQYLCCENCGGPHESFQCQPMNQNHFEHNSNYSGFDQPPQYSINHQEDLNQQRISDVHDGWDKLEESYNEIFNMVRSFCEMVIQRKQAAKISIHTPEPSRHFNFTCDDDDDDEEYSIPLKDMPQIYPSIALAPVSSIMEPEDSLIMGNEELSTIPEKESDEFIKSSVEDLIPIPRESEDTSGSDSESVLPSSDDFSPIFEEKSVTFSNPLFDSNNDFTSSDDESLSDEDVPEDVKIYSNPLFEFDDEYISSDVNPLFDEDECLAPRDDIELLLHHDPSISIVSILEGFIDEPPLEENDDLFDLESKENDWKNILYDAPTDDLIIKDKSSNLDHFNDPSPSCPPPKPPDVEFCFNFEPDTGVLTTKVMKGISEHHVLMPNILPSLPNLDPDLDFTPSHDSLGSGNKIFDPGIFIEVQSERLLSRDEFSISFIRDPLSLVFDTLLYFHPKTRTKCSILVQRIENKAKTVTDMSVLVRGRRVPVRGQSARNPCQ